MANTQLDPSHHSDPNQRVLAGAVQSAARRDLMRRNIFSVHPELQDLSHDILPRWFEAGPDADIASLLAEVEAAWQELDALNAEG